MAAQEQNQYQNTHVISCFLHTEKNMKLYPTQRYIHEAAIDVPDIPPESLVSSYEAYRALGASKCNKGCGPDGISNRILKTFAFERGLV